MKKHTGRLFLFLAAAMIFFSSFSLSKTLLRVGRLFSESPLFQAIFGLTEEEAREVFAPAEEAVFL